MSRDIGDFCWLGEMLMTRFKNDDSLDEKVSPLRPVDAANFKLTVLLIKKIEVVFVVVNLVCIFSVHFMVFILSALSLILILNFGIEPRSKTNHGSTRF